jgi:BirA family transcriptional regulator, biotin operon repressor / biotin---[acetyl-CoA-carboxylase] ligase
MERLAITNPFPGAAAFLVGTTVSTQEDIKRLAAEGLPPGSLVVAEEQSAGRGRFPERSWASERGKNLLVSLYLGRPRAALPIRVGLALCEAVSDYAARIGTPFPSPPRLKWPNDLMLGDRKTAGILCESSVSGPATAMAAGAAVFAGIGLNCNQLRFPGELGGKATSLALELGREVDRWAIVELLLGRLAAGLGTELAAEEAEVLEGSAAGWHRKVNERLWRRGQAASFLPGLSGKREGGPRETIRGTLEGVDDEGSILIRSPGELEARAFAAGELTAGPPPDNMKP